MIKLEDDEKLATEVASLIVTRREFDDTSRSVLALVSKRLAELEEDRFSKVLAVFREYLLDLDHDIEGCSGPELEEISQHHVATLELRRRLVAHVVEGADARGQRPGGDVGPFFYIQDARTYVGDAVLWWRPEGKGYTTKLAEAGIFTKEKANTGRKTDVAISVEAARRAARTVVHMPDLRESLAKEKG